MEDNCAHAATESHSAPDGIRDFVTASASDLFWISTTACACCREQGIYAPQWRKPARRPIEICALSRLQVWINGELLELGGRTQRKPIELLKSLLVRPAGLACSVLMENLWPDLDGDAARNALDLALYRLRRLLKRKDAVLIENRTLMLNRGRVWVDAWALQRLCDCDLPRNTMCAQDLLNRMHALLHLYRGAFLENDESPWIFAARDRSHSTFTRGALNLARALQSLELWHELQTLYVRVLELDPLNEAFHRGLIHTLRMRGLHAEAMLAYRRCCGLLAKLLGTEPCAATRAAIRSLAGSCSSGTKTKKQTNHTSMGVGT